MIYFVLGCLALVLLAGLASALALVASSPPKVKEVRDVFGFSSLKSTTSNPELPPLRRYPARDGEELAYRIYDSSADRVLIFLHGSSYHGAGYHVLASSISASGAAKVVLPNLRGHFLSGRHRGDVEYIGQLEDDISDLVRFLRHGGLQGDIVLGGHSSGGGLAIRFAGGAYGQIASNLLLLSPIIPTSPAVRNAAGGWTSLHTKRLYGLLLLNAMGIHGFDGLPIIEFNKPTALWDGTETLSYSHRLNVSYHPRYRYADDIRALRDKALVLVGTNDEAVDPEKLRNLFDTNATGSHVTVLPELNHFQVFMDPTALRSAIEFLSQLPHRDR
jgi:pimeloyl-ACP methyl ester carboxylesterase